jgi:hypothetical protein
MKHQTSTPPFLPEKREVDDNFTTGSEGSQYFTTSQPLSFQVLPQQQCQYNLNHYQNNYNYNVAMQIHNNSMILTNGDSSDSNYNNNIMWSRTMMMAQPPPSQQEMQANNVSHPASFVPPPSSDISVMPRKTAETSTSSSMVSNPTLIHHHNRVGEKNQHQHHPPQEQTNKRFRYHQTDQWTAMYEKLVEYRNTHGHCRVAHSSKTHPELGRWVKRQRYQYKLCSEDNRKSTMTGTL